MRLGLCNVGIALICRLLWLAVVPSANALTASFYHQMLKLYSQPSWIGDIPESHSSQRNEQTFDTQHMLQAWTYMKLKAKDQDKILMVGNISEALLENTVVASFQNNKDSLMGYPIVNIQFNSTKAYSSSSAVPCPEQMTQSLPWLSPSRLLVTCDERRGIIYVNMDDSNVLFAEEKFLSWVGQRVHTMVTDATLSIWNDPDRISTFFRHLLRNRSPIAPAISLLVPTAQYDTLSSFSELKSWLRSVQFRYPMNVDTFSHNLVKVLYPNIATILNKELALLSVDILPRSRLVAITPTIRWENLDLVRASLRMSHVTEWVIVYGYNSSNKAPPPMRQLQHDVSLVPKINEIVYDYATEAYSNAGNGERNMALRYLYRRYFPSTNDTSQSSVTKSQSHRLSLLVDNEKNKKDSQVQSACDMLVKTNEDRLDCAQKLLNDKWVIFLDDDNAVHANFWQLYMHWSLPQLHMVAMIMVTKDSFNPNSLVYPQKCKVYWFDVGQVTSSLYFLYRSGVMWQLWPHEADGLFYQDICSHYPSWLRMWPVAGSYHNALLAPHSLLEKDI